MVQTASASKPGFINVKLQDDWIANHALDVATHGVLPRAVSEPKKVLVDFASPNMGKELHVGHLRSSVLGDTICNILEFQGHVVNRVSHVGDLGAAIATLLVQSQDSQDNGSNNLPIEFDSSTPISTLGQWYERGKQRLSRGDVTFKSMVDETVLAMQREDPAWKASWGLTCEISRLAHKCLFDRLGVQVRERGESTYIKLIPLVLEKLRSVAEESQGALCIFVDGHEKTPMLIQKQDGGKQSEIKTIQSGATTLQSLLDEAGIESQQRSVVADADHRAIGDAAVRYYDLAQHRERNYKFSYANVLNLKGNTAPYLMYASARLHGILRNAEVSESTWREYLDSQDDAKSLLTEASQSWQPQERALALVLAQFEDALIETQAN
ncbi:unnamed protein product, partial [Aphanomyces euteiches]